jgi:hypothetical protein
MGGLMSKPKVPVMPAPAPLPEYTPPPPTPAPVAMPTPDDTAIMTAKKKKTALEMQRSGRASTVLTDNGDDSLG